MKTSQHTAGHSRAECAIRPIAARPRHRAPDLSHSPRFTYLRLLATVCLAALLAMPSMVTAATAKEERVYLALGDSLAVGVGATRPQHNGYVPRLFRFFHGRSGGRAMTLTNLGVAGATSTSFISGGQLAQALSVIKADSNVVVVTIDLGGNDLLSLLAPGQLCAIDPASVPCQTAIAGALTDFATNFPTILTQLTTALAGDPGEEQLLVATFYNPFSGLGPPYEVPVDRLLLASDGKVDCTGSGAQLGLNDLIACIAKQSGATVVDVYPLFVDKGSQLTHIKQQDIHPTNAGYATIAKAFRRAFQAAT